MSEKCNCQCCVIWRKYEKRWKDKIAKLETEIHSLKHDPMTVANYNQIKIEGIDEMLNEIRWDSDADGCYYVYDLSIYAYIAKLKGSKDE